MQEKIFKKLIFLFLFTIVFVSLSSCEKEEVVNEVDIVEEKITENTKENTDSLEDINDDLVTITTEEINDEFELKAKMDTSDWLTYRNEEYGFEVKYPRDWEAYETHGDSKKNKGDIVEGLILSTPEDLPGGGTLSIGFSGGNDSKVSLVKDSISIIHSICPDENIDVIVSKFNNAETISFNVKNDYCDNQYNNWGISHMYIKSNNLSFLIANINNPHVNFKFTK